MAGIPNHTNWHISHQKEMPLYKQIRNTKNTQTTQIILGLHAPHNKVHRQTRKIIRTTIPLLSKNNTKSQNKLDWKDHNTTAFEEIKRQITNITENKHFDINKEKRVKCDAGRKGLGACPEQKQTLHMETSSICKKILQLVR